MAGASGAPAWRSFEELVAAIERHLGPLDVVVRSPDHIPDKITGALREVDASIRYQLGSAEILITVECRDRKRRADVRWIEELSAKRNDIGANVTIAVSSSGFSVAALKKAKMRNIETRVLREISEDDIRSWASGLLVHTIQGRFRISSIRPFFAAAVPAGAQSAIDVAVARARDDIEHKFISSGTEVLSIGDFLRAHDRNRTAEPSVKQLTKDGISIRLPPGASQAIALGEGFPTLFENVPTDGTHVDRRLTLRFKQGEAKIATGLGSSELEHLEVDVTVFQEMVPAQVGRLRAYEVADTRIANVEERDILIGSDRFLRAVITGRDAPKTSGVE